MSFFCKLNSKLRSSFFVFKKAEILQNMVSRELAGNFEHTCQRCWYRERWQTEKQTSSLLRFGVKLGGALGDYIVYLRFLDELSAACQCEIDVFLTQITFGAFVFGDRENIAVIHDPEEHLFFHAYPDYDLALHLDHGVTIYHSEPGVIRSKTPEFYGTACSLIKGAREGRICLDDQFERESVALRRAKIFGDTKWSLLSCGDVVDMSSMYSNLVLNMDWVSVLDRYGLRQRRYITVNFGADRNMGGAAQTKLLPVDTLTGFIACFRAAHPEYLVVQTGVKNSPELTGADRYAFDCRLEETAILLKCSALHVDCEGGLVHLASQLSTPCVVAFGPTPAYYYGYPRNENIVSPACGDCMSATSQWSRVCPRGMQPPVCMQAITPKILLDAAEKRLPAEDAAKPEPRCDSLVSASQRAEPGQRVCLIGALDKSIETAALMLVQHGCRVWIYIPPEGAARCAGIRMHLKQAGVRVEYGNMFNIAAPSGSFDWAFCQSAGLSEKLHPLALDECARLTADNGGIVLCQEDVS